MEMENHHKARLESQDWSNLPIEILQQFCKWLRITDQVQFGIVCKTWFSSTANKSQIWVPETPWLITNDDMSSQFQLLRDYSDKKVIKIYKPFKPLRGTFIVGSFKGWLVIRSQAKLFILNLLCKLRVNLPLQSTVPGFLSSSKGIYMDTPLAFAISTCAKLNPIFVAMVTYGGDLCWCKIGDTAWRGYQGDGESSYGNVAFHNDKLYAADRDGDQVDIFRVDDQVLLPVASILPAEPDVQSQSQSDSDPIDVYLVECGGRLLVVKRYYDNSQILRSTLSFIILRVEEDCGSCTPKLVRVDNLEDHVLFVADHSCESLHAKYCPGLQCGCVYFTGYSTNYIIAELGQFCVADGTMRRRLLSDPRLYSPLWVMPRFAFECNCESCNSAPWIRPRKIKKKSIYTT